MKGRRSSDEVTDSKCVKKLGCRLLVEITTVDLRVELSLRDGCAYVQVKSLHCNCDGCKGAESSSLSWTLRPIGMTGVILLLVGCS